MKTTPLILFVIAIAWPSVTWAHEKHTVETPSVLAARQAYLTRSKRSLENCINSGQSLSALQKNARVRREALLRSIRQEQSFPPGGMFPPHASVDPSKLTNHHSNQTGLTNYSIPVFDRSVCILTPEADLGPFFVKGELIRKDSRENKSGIDLYLDVQLIDVKTCQPIRNVYIDTWNANATGVYSGVPGGYGGLGQVGDLANLNTTFNRGLQPTDYNGVAQFVTKFPGHYPGRTNHVHVMVHLNGTLLPNGTYTSGPVSYIGQLFSDQDLLDSIETTFPYSTNTNPRTMNTEDMDVSTTINAGGDTFLEYALLGNSVQDGLLGWVTLGLNLEADDTAEVERRYGATWTDHGGVANPNSMSGGGGGGGPVGPAMGPAVGPAMGPAMGRAGTNPDCAFRNMTGKNSLRGRPPGPHGFRTGPHRPEPQGPHGDPRDGGPDKRPNVAPPRAEFTGNWEGC